MKPNSEIALFQEYVKLWSWFFLSGSAFREVTQIYSIISSDCGQVYRDLFRTTTFSRISSGMKFFLHVVVRHTQTVCSYGYDQEK